jgi:hypothetical protein
MIGLLSLLLVVLYVLVQFGEKAAADFDFSMPVID